MDNVERIIILVEGQDKSGNRTLEQLNRNLDGASKAGAKASIDLKSVTTVLKNVTAGAAAFGVTWKKAFDLGREGAVIAQTDESFQGLMDTIRGGTDILEALDQATADTLSDMELMSRVNQALTGTQGEVKQAIAESLPALYEMSRAATKLAPEIGSVDFVYDSLIRGIRKGSPLLIDNANIMVKAGGANEAYAAKVGKTVAELTDEERTLATLNAVMEQHAGLIEQAGGSLDSQTDAYDRMWAAIKNLADDSKRWLHDFLEPAAQATYQLLTWTKQINQVYADHNKEVAQVASSYEEYVAEMVRAAVVAKLLKEDLADEMVQAYLTGDATQFLMEAYGLLDEETVQLQFDTTLLGEDMAVTVDKLQIMTQEAWENQSAMAGMNEEIFAGEQALTRYSQAQNTFAARAAEGARQMRINKREQDQLNASLATAKGRLDGVNTSLGNTIQTYQRQIEWIQGGGGVLEDAAEKILEMYNMKLIDGDTASEALDLVQLGVIDLEEELGWIDTTTVVERLTAMGFPIDEAQAKAIEFEETLFRITSRDYNVNMIVNQVGGGRGVVGSGGAAGGGDPGTATDLADLWTANAMTAPVHGEVPTGHMDDSYLVAMRTGEQFAVWNRNQQSPLGGANISVHINIERVSSDVDVDWMAERVIQRLGELR